MPLLGAELLPNVVLRFPPIADRVGGIADELLDQVLSSGLCALLKILQLLNAKQDDGILVEQAVRVTANDAVENLVALCLQMFVKLWCVHFDPRFGKTLIKI